jgi:hypothetical protein
MQYHIIHTSIDTDSLFFVKFSFCNAVHLSESDEILIYYN